MTDATRHGLFRRLRRATSRRPPVPSPNSSAPDPIRRPEGRLGAETWVRHESDDRLRVEDILETAAGPREPIGELLVKSGRITRPQLDLALAEQRQGREKLGEILVRKCWLTEPELGALLAFQERLGTG